MHFGAVRIGVLLLSAAAWAQIALPAAGPSAAAANAVGKPAPAQNAPSKVDKALRARALEFLSYQTEGNYLKAFDLVAEESKEYFLSVGKERISSPKLTSISYTDHFSQAVVTATLTRKTNMGQAGIIELPSSRQDSWKLVHGKWMWFRDPSGNCMVTLVGVLPCEGVPGKQGLVGASAGPGVLPKDTSPNAVAEAAKVLAEPKAVISRKAVEFVKGQAATEEISFHNGYPGYIRVSVGLTRPTEELTLSENSKMVAINGDFSIKITYTPGAGFPESQALMFSVEPFGRMYEVPVRLLTAPVKQP